MLATICSQPGNPLHSGANSKHQLKDGELMRKRRHGQPDHNLTNGPGKLSIAMGIDRKLDAADLLGGRVWLEAGRTIPRSQIASGPRIGIDYAEEWRDKPWRLWIRDNSFVSRR